LPLDRRGSIGSGRKCVARRYPRLRLAINTGRSGDSIGGNSGLVQQIDLTSLGICQCGEQQSLAAAPWRHGAWAAPTSEMYEHSPSSDAVAFASPRAPSAPWHATRAHSSLAYRVFEDAASGVAPTKTAFIMHGILGASFLCSGRLDLLCRSGTWWTNGCFPIRWGVPRQQAQLAHVLAKARGCATRLALCRAGPPRYRRRYDVVYFGPPWNVLV
jgi:hypothetical protein